MRGKFAVFFAEARLVRYGIARLAMLSAVVFFSWSCGVFSNSSRSGEVGSPHPVILIDIDTLRADHLGCYGYQRDTSPTIDRLASEGLLFEWAFAQAPNTPPSQTSILTSLYPHSHGRMSSKDILSEEITTLAEVMAENGFKTAAFVDGGFMAPRWGLDQGFQRYVSRPQKKKGLAALGPRIKQWVEENAEENFFLLIHTYDVHTSYDPPPPFRDSFLQGVAPSTPGFEPTAKTMKTLVAKGRKGHTNILTAEDVEYAKALYDGGILYVDHWLESFVDDLERLGLMDTATLVVLSDHGEEFQEHGSVLHEKLYATVTRIPLIIRPPGGTKGRRISQVVESIDVMPTILEMVGVPLPVSPVEGQSLAHWLSLESQGSAIGSGRAFGESPYFGGREFIIEGSHHLLRTVESGKLELYNFREDPLEQNDSASVDRAHAENLENILQSWGSNGRHHNKNVSGVDLDEETASDLRALGYLD